MRYLLLVLSIFAFAPAVALEPASGIKLESDRLIRITHYKLDHKTKLTGWRVGKEWYFGRQKGEDSGLTLVWQGKQDQLSFSREGIRLTRRF